MKTKAQALIEKASEAGLEIEYLIRDNDGMYVKEFNEVFENAGCKVIPTAVQAPNQNAFIERWIKSIKHEYLNHFMVFGQKHFDFIVSEYLEHYNGVRPHQGLENRPLLGVWSQDDEPLTDDEQIVCHERLGGILKRYERKAA